MLLFALECVFAKDLIQTPAYFYAVLGELHELVLQVVKRGVNGLLALLPSFISFLLGPSINIAL